MALFGFSAISLAVIARQPWGARLVAVLLLFWIGYSAATFKWQGNLAILRESAPWARNMWRLHHELLEFAYDRDIIVIHPQNHYGYGGVAEFLLKGTADVPTWNVTTNGRPILERYAPRMSYRHEYSGPHPNAPYPENVILFWIDRPEFPPLTEQYALLKAACFVPETEQKTWSMVIQGGRATIVAHAVKLPPGGVSHKKPMVTAPPEGFAGTRVKPDTIRLVWQPDRITHIAFQFKSRDGEWFALGRANPTMEAYMIGDINPAITYTIRARKEFADERSDWVEVVVPPLSPAPVTPSEQPK